MRTVLQNPFLATVIFSHLLSTKFLMSLAGQAGPKCDLNSRKMNNVCMMRILVTNILTPLKNTKQVNFCISCNNNFEKAEKLDKIVI